MPGCLYVALLLTAGPTAGRLLELILKHTPKGGTK